MNRLAAVKPCFIGMAGMRTPDQGQRVMTAQIAGAEGEPIHGRVIKGRHIHGGQHRLGQHPMQ